jgi:hypothetical protein
MALNEVDEKNKGKRAEIRRERKTRKNRKTYSCFMSLISELIRKASL